jgi:GrpB-like predicted nucleotidyltransferase (UPF0157 family)
MAQYPREITQRFHGTPEQMAAALVGEPPATWQSIIIEDYDPAWADRFATASSLLGEALTGLIIAIEHVGSTSVPGLVSPAEDVHLHVWPAGAPEPVRHRLFRDWLRAHPADRDLYAATKRRLARDTVHRPGDYSLAKNDVIDVIYVHIFAASNETDQG